MTVVPIMKVGAVLVRGGAAPEVLIVRPIPKREGEVPPFVLPRGTRQYPQETNGEIVWLDARDARTAMAHANALEPFKRTLKREIHEEAGLAPEDLDRAMVRTIGTREFTSRSQVSYPIHWYMVTPDAAGIAAMAQHMPADALETRWATLATIKAMAAAGTFSSGYVPVLEEALALRQTKPGRSRRGGEPPAR